MHDFLKVYLTVSLLLIKTLRWFPIAYTKSPSSNIQVLHYLASFATSNMYTSCSRYAKLIPFPRRDVYLLFSTWDILFCSHGKTPPHVSNMTQLNHPSSGSLRWSILRILFSRPWLRCYYGIIIWCRNPCLLLCFLSLNCKFPEDKHCLFILRLWCLAQWLTHRK